MALPFGVEPHRRALLPSGSWKGEAYRNEGVLLVGANPSASPFHASFDPMAIPAFAAPPGTTAAHRSPPGTGSATLKAHRDQLYVAAGNPGAVTAPKALKSWSSTSVQAPPRHLLTGIDGQAGAQGAASS